jgi:hypothetical protein
VHPITLISVLIVIVNDRLLKPHLPGALSGKLSDFAGLVMFPLIVTGLVELARSRWTQAWRLGPGFVPAVVGLEALIFLLIKTWTPAADVYRAVVGAGLWCLRLPLSPWNGAPEYRRALHIEDPSDLWALAVLPIPVLAARSVQRRDAVGAEP